MSMKSQTYHFLTIFLKVFLFACIQHSLIFAILHRGRKVRDTNAIFLFGYDFFVHFWSFFFLICCYYYHHPFWSHVALFNNFIKKENHKTMKFKRRQGEFKQGCVWSESYTATDAPPLILLVLSPASLPVMFFVSKIGSWCEVLVTWGSTVICLAFWKDTILIYTHVEHTQTLGIGIVG